MDDQQTLAVVNHDIPLEKLQSLLRQGNSTSFIFSIKNRVGGLARALKVFQVIRLKNDPITKINFVLF